MIRRLATLALLLAAMPANADQGTLAGEAGMARYALAADGTSFLDRSDSESRAVFEYALGGDSYENLKLWSHIMAGAIQLRHEYAGDAETLWFNPLFDAGMAVGWRQGPNGWQAVAAIPVTGEMLRGEAVSTAPLDWSGGGIKALVEARARATWQAAATRVWIGLPADDAGTSAMVRAHEASETLERMRVAPGYAEAIYAAWQALTTDEETLLPERVRRGLVLTGYKARLTLRPVAAFERPDGWSVAMQSPDAPRLTWLAHFTPPARPGGEAVLRSYQLVDMGAGQ